MFDNLTTAYAKSIYGSKSKSAKSDVKPVKKTQTNIKNTPSVIVSRSPQVAATPKPVLSLRALRPAQNVFTEPISTSMRVEQDIFKPKTTPLAIKSKNVDLEDLFFELKSEDANAKNKALSARESEVQKHEAAHILSGTGVTGGLSYTYQTGANGEMFAIGGEVSVDMSAGATPEETIEKAQKIRAAALAPSDPSMQDHELAMAALKMEQQAREERAEKQKEIQEKLKETAEKFQEVAEQILTPIDTEFMKNVGDVAYMPLTSEVVIPAPTSPTTGKEFLNATNPKETDRRLVYQEQTFTFRPVLSKKSEDPLLNETAKVQRKINKPKMVAIKKKLKTDAKPVVYTNEISVYKSVEKLLRDSNLSNKFELKLATNEQFAAISGKNPQVAVDQNFSQSLQSIFKLV
ncbi:MAG: putative metalloprotease CJM1_0395 family protein [Myxococcota bacterium]|nr:putative metalloprotease CJM1_0395 family protein [Myxococcota bacterium]